MSTAALPSIVAPKLAVWGAADGSLAINVIATLLAFHALYFAAALFVPIVCALLLSMLLGPLVTRLEQLHVPRPIAAFMVVLGSISILAFGASLLSGPAQSWMEKAPQGLHRLQERLAPLQHRLQSLTQAGETLQRVGKAGDGAQPQKVVLVRPALMELALGTPHALAPLVSVFMLMFLLLVAGDVFLRKLVAIIPTFREKKRTVEIIRAMEDDISYYLLMFFALNIGLGASMGVATYLIGIPNPALWGTMVAILNCVPYVGPVASMAVLTIAGLTTFENLTQAMLAPAIMLGLAIVSTQVVTPLVVGRGLRLNPVAIFISVILWGWLWGIVGVLLAVPAEYDAKRTVNPRQAGQ